MPASTPNTPSRRTELSQSITRIVICSAALLYFIVAYLIGDGYQNLDRVIFAMTAYLLYSTGIFILVKRFPQPVVWRRGLTIVTDLMISSYGFYLGDAYGAMIYPVYLWIIVGNGLRFGVNYLLFAMAIGIMCLAFVLFSSEYWVDHTPLAVGLLMGIILLPSFYAVILRELEATNKDLERQKQAAEQADIAKSRFLAAASHDLRQPLQAQALFVAELYERLHDQEKSRVLIEKLEDSIDSLRGQFNALLDISKLDAGIVIPTKRHFRIHALFNVIKEEYIQQAKAKGLELDVHCSDVVVYSDVSLLDSVLRNLVVNAIRYTHEGKVLIECYRDEDYLSIQVNDTGPGIEHTYLDDIFQEFFQINNPERNRDQGLGLGLSVVRRVAKLLECSVSVSSTVGKGSSFRIDVPLGDEAEIVSESKINTEHAKHVLSGTNVIIIDDEQAILEAMAGLLESWGCIITVSGSGEDMLFKVSEENLKPDIIVADYRLPGSMTGVQAIAEIREHLKADIPAILITGDIAVEKLQDVKDSSIPFLHKPVQPGRLRTLIHHLVSTQ